MEEIKDTLPLIIEEEVVEEPSIDIKEEEINGVIWVTEKTGNSTNTYRKETNE